MRDTDFDPPPHPAIAKIELGHAIDRLAQAVLEGGGQDLVGPLQATAAELDRAWRVRVRAKQEQVEMALGYNSPQPWQKLVEEVAQLKSWADGVGAGLK